MEKTIAQFNFKDLYNDLLKIEITYNELNSPNWKENQLLKRHNVFNTDIEIIKNDFLCKTKFCLETFVEINTRITKYVNLARINIPLKHAELFSYGYKEYLKMTSETMLPENFDLLYKQPELLNQLTLSKLTRASFILNYMNIVLIELVKQNKVEIHEKIYQNKDYRSLVDLNKKLEILRNFNELEENWKPIISHLNTQIKSLEKSENKLYKKSIHRTHLSFNLRLNDNDLYKLYEALNENFIESTFEEFKALFSDKSTKIIWLKSNALLAFFVIDLFQKNNPNNYWQIAESIFVDKNNNPFTSLKQSYNTAYQNNKDNQPKGYSNMKSIYSHLL